VSAKHTKARDLKISVPRAVPQGWQQEGPCPVYYAPNGMRITVHQYVGYDKDEWFVSVHGLGMDRVPLGRHAEAPLGLALGTVRRHCVEALAAITIAYDTLPAAS
jgi:hypothetical protein